MTQDQESDDAPMHGEGPQEPSPSLSSTKHFKSDDGTDWFVGETVEHVEVVEADLDNDPQTRPWTADDHARMTLLRASLVIFSGTILLGFFTIWLMGESKRDHAQALINALLPVESLLLGGAVTYWFKTKNEL